jgi:hypothetical protein
VSSNLTCGTWKVPRLASQTVLKTVASARMRVRCLHFPLEVTPSDSRCTKKGKKMEFEDIVWAVKEYFRFKINRLKCWLNGSCTTYHGSSYNMPDDYYAPTYCKVCGACYDQYGIETTDYDFIYEHKTPIGFFKMWREGRIDWS